MKHIDIIDLCAGIGGFSLAGKWVGFQTSCFVEINPFCQKVLRKNFPGIPIWEDIKTFGRDKYYEITGRTTTDTDIITAGFPCQPFSRAGRQKGKQDDRFLWPEVFRIISEAHPRWVVCENVTAIDGMVLDDMLVDLESIGYETAPPLEIPACAAQAPHRRSRCFVVAHSCQTGLERIHQAGHEIYLQRSEKIISRHQWKTTPRVFRRGHGIPDRVDRTQALGNAVVPQLVAILFKAIWQVEAMTS